MRKKKYAAFTLLEMLIVLLVISVLLLLFIPNLSDKRTAINEQGRTALEKVISTQVEMYTLDKNSVPASLAELKQSKYITEEQYKKAVEYGIELK